MGVGNTLGRVWQIAPGIGLLAIILGYYPPTPFEDHISEDIAPKYKSGALKAAPRSLHTLRMLKILTGDLVTGLPPTVSLTP